MEKKILDAEERVRKSGLTVRQTCEGLFLLLHAFLLGEGFVAVVVAEGSAPAGFAAPMRELPAGVFLPPNWAAEEGSATCRYKHRSRLGKQYNLVVVEIEESLVVTLSERNGDSFSLDLSPASRFLTLTTPDNNSSSDSDKKKPVYHDCEALYMQFMDIVRRFLPPPAPPAVAEPGPSFLPHHPSPAPYPLVGVPAEGRFGVGRADLFPSGPIPVPGGPSPGFGRAEGGNLVGPGHPMFQPYAIEPDFPDPMPGMPGWDLPHPRFDPFGPITGPNSDVDFGGRGGFPGRGIMPRGPGRGNGRGNRLFPGEPNNDHFKPPGW